MKAVIVDAGVAVVSPPPAAGPKIEYGDGWIKIDGRGATLKNGTLEEKDGVWTHLCPQGEQCRMRCLQGNRCRAESEGVRSWQVCSPSATCHYDCKAGNCVQECQAGAICIFTCKGGKCWRKVDFDQVSRPKLKITCEGGGCQDMPTRLLDH